MNTGRLVSQNDKLQKERSKLLSNMVIDDNASEDDVRLGLYRPRVKILSLLRTQEQHDAATAAAELVPIIRTNTSK
jgi:hypothetical protein